MINLPCLVSHFLSLHLNPFDIGQNCSYINFLAFQSLDHFIDALQILVPVDILRQVLPLLLHVGKDLLLVLSVRNGLLEVFLQILNLVVFVLILHTPVCHLLLLLENLIIDGLLVLFPLFFQGF